MTSKEMVIKYLNWFKVGRKNYDKTFESKMFNKILQDLDKLKKLEKENQELKEKIQLSNESQETVIKTMSLVDDENERLKKEIKKLLSI